MLTVQTLTTELSGCLMRLMVLMVLNGLHNQAITKLKSLLCDYSSKCLMTLADDFTSTLLLSLRVNFSPGP